MHTAAFALLAALAAPQVADPHAQHGHRTDPAPSAAVAAVPRTPLGDRISRPQRATRSVSSRAYTGVRS
jgi:hypothetical protein